MYWRLEKMFWVGAISLIVVASSIAVAQAQTTVDRITVDMPYRVAVADKVLDPTKLEIREVSQNLLQFFNSNELKVEATVFTIPTFDNQPSPETRVVLRKYGNDEYYIDRIWLQGRTYGYEFRVPERVRSWEREYAMAPSVPAAYDEVDRATLDQPAGHTAKVWSGWVGKIEKDAGGDYNLVIGEPAARVYTLDGDSTEFENLVGELVKVQGDLSGTTLRVTKVESMSRVS
jgi:hypothetical protein